MSRVLGSNPGEATFLFLFHGNEIDGAVGAVGGMGKNGKIEKKIFFF